MEGTTSVGKGKGILDDDTKSLVSEKSEIKGDKQ